MLKILKASAGSGKTYNLAKEYLRLILQSDRPDAYRHVLAVTFTNKATDEMKRRILKELSVLAQNPQASPYLKDFVPNLFAQTALLQQKARQQLSALLHDYSAFAVSTIDRFFQQTLRAFSREIGQFASYQVQLDREALVTESVDRVLDQLSETDRTLLDWLTRSVREDLSQRGKFSLEGRLQEVAGSLQSLPAGQTFTHAQLDSLRHLCKRVIQDYEERVSRAAGACLKVLEEAGIDPRDSNRSFLKQLYSFTDPETPVGKPTDSFLQKAPDPSLWFAKSKDALRLRVQGVLDAPLEEFLSCFGQPYRVYTTAQTLLGQLYGLGVADRLRAAFAEIQREKNVLSIDDSNTLLHQIIDGTDTPFIYEKMGVRYEDFLLDESQDTADIQWENIRPLLLNSEANGHDSLIVGDVKQSIYRWRGGDWSLLGSRLEKEFRDVQVTPLDGNYRTCREIVNFNNAFFAYAARELDLLLGEDPEGKDSISALYGDVRQDVRFADPAPGSVEVRFADDQLAEILDTLARIRERGGEWSDVAILVRGNAEGSLIAASLVEQGIPVVSDDSLFVKTSISVRRLVSQLSLVDAPPTEERATAAAYLARSMQMELPEHYHSLIDLAEALLRNIRAWDPETFEAEIPYIQSFMDYLQDWVALNGNKLHAFLRGWEEADPKMASPQGGNSVRVMTIHKSKGLEFPFVIVPFAEKITLYKASSRWCRPVVEGTPLASEADGFFRVKLDSWAADSLFARDYARERKLEAVDNINVFYVALTRAKYGLKIIAAPIPKNLGGWKNMSQLLYGYVQAGDYRTGTPYQLGGLRREEHPERTLVMGYASYPADSGNRLRFSPEAADYFGEDGQVGVLASRRIRGNVLHGILARILTPDDVPSALDAAVLSGELPAAERADTAAFLRERLASVEDRGWFSPWARVLREAPVIGIDGREYRPDRVVMAPDGSVTVVDYKFGVQKDSYRAQVRRYVELYRRMGYGKVAGYLWYLDENFTIFVAG